MLLIQDTFQLPKIALYHCNSHEQMQGASEQTKESLQPASDDWRPITDRKVKKRIQNRVAQRTYRNRLKQRLEELQQQVDEYERRDAEKRSAESEDSISIEQNSVQSLNSLNPSICEDQRSNDPSDEFQPDPTFEINLPPVRQGSNNMMWRVHEKKSFTSTSLDGAETPFMPYMQFQQPEDWNLLSCKSSSEDTRATGLEYGSNAFYYNTAHQSGASASVSCQQPNTSNNNYLQPLPLPSSSSTAEDSAHIPHSIFTDQSLSGPVLPLETTKRINDVGFDATMSQMPQRDEMLGSPSATASSAITIAESWKLPGKQAPVEERLEYLLACAKAIGFDSFENLLIQFYGLNCDRDSHLAIEQWLGRSRRLPAFLAQLRDQAGSWAQWQQRGYQEEILKSAKQLWGRTDY